LTKKENSANMIEEYIKEWYRQVILLREKGLLSTEEVAKNFYTELNS